jgi:hypothetical protein
MNTAQRVAARWLEAGLLGDPETLFRKLSELKKTLDELSPLMPVILEGEALIQENYRYRWTPPPDKKDLVQRLEQAESKMGQGTSLVTRLLGDVAHDLFLSILQQYNLPKDVRRKVEVQAKVWTKKKPAKIKGKYSEVYQGIYALVTTAYEVAREALASGTPISGSDSEVVVGAFKLINTGGFPPQIMEGVVKALEKAEYLLRSKGFGKVCYGEVYVTRTIKGSALAFYVIAQDALFVRANFRNPVDLVYNIIHELAHRLDHKFLSSKKQEIRRLYNSLALKAKFSRPDVEPPEPGKDLRVDNKAFVVDRVQWPKIYIRKPEEDPAAPSKSYITMDAYARIKAQAEGRPPFGDDGFVTEYAAKNEHENFAEMVTNYCLGKLQPSLVEKLEAITG